MYCPNCGAFVDDNSVYCTVCGAQIISEQAQKIDTAKASETAGTEILSNDYEETGRLDENTVTQNYENFTGSAPITYGNQPVNTQQTYRNYGNYSSQNFDEKHFYKQFASKNTKSWVNLFIIACFVTAVFTSANIFKGNTLYALDCIFYLVFGILLVFKKKWYFFLVVSIYSGIGTILAITSGNIGSGLLALVAGIISTVKIKKLNALFKQYKEYGIFPQNEI